MVWVYWIGVRLAGRDPLPRARRRMVSWDWAQTLACLLGFFCLTVVFGMLALVAAGPSNVAASLAAAVMFEATAAVGIPWFLRLACDAKPYQLGITDRHLSRDVRYGVLGLLAALIPVYGVLLAVAEWLGNPSPHAVEKLLAEEPTAANVGLVMLTAVVMAPLAEEILFRGVLLGWLKRVTGAWPAIAVSSAVFAAAHFDTWPAPLGLFPLAVILGYLYHRTQSLVAPVVVHAGFNGLSVLMLLVKVWLEPSAV